MYYVTFPYLVKECRRGQINSARAIMYWLEKPDALKFEVHGESS